jgi:antitoxin VapB
MPLNIKNREVERLAAEVAALARETKTEAIRRSLAERKLRLGLSGGRGPLPKTERLRAALETRIWPEIPKHMLGRRISKKERERILGYGPMGV